MQSIPARIRPGRTPAPKQWAVTFAPSAWAASIAAANASAGKLGARSPSSRSIQSPTSLIHPSPARASCAAYVGELVGLDLVGVVADVALGATDVTTAADQPRQVVAVLDPAGVGGAAGVADQQRPAVAVVDRLLLGLLVGGGAEVVEPEVAVGVDQPGHDPALAGGLGAGWRS